MIIYCLLTNIFFCTAQREQVTFLPGPSTGIITQEIPNILLTEHRVLSQLIYIDLDFVHALNKYFSPEKMRDDDVMLWFSRHVDRTEDSIREILAQTEKTIVINQPPSSRPRRAIGAIIMGVMALLTVVGAVVGGSVNAANSATIKEIMRKNDILQASLQDIQRSIALQHATNEHFVKVIKDTIVVSDLQSQRIDHVVKVQEQAARSRDEFYNFIDPILFFTTAYLRQLETDMQNLLRAHIPLYFVDTRLVRQALSNLHGPEIDPTQLNIAFEAGSAIPMHIDVIRMQVSFLLNIPLVKLDKMYQLKKVWNVGTWKGDTRIKINSPQYIAYQNTSTMYLIPQLQNCQIFKDLNYLCPGNPFTPVTGGLCGLEESTSDSTLCDVTILRTTDILTEAVLIGNVWLVSTNAPNMTITYTQHGTFAVKPVQYSTFTVQVPRDIIVTVGSETLFYVNSEGMEGGMELVNSFRSFSIPHNPDLDFLLEKKSSHSLQLLLQEGNVSISDLQFSSEDNSHINSPDFWELVAKMMWSGGLTCWVILLTILVVIHNKLILQMTKVVRDRQTELRQEELQRSII